MTTFHPLVRASAVLMLSAFLAVPAVADEAGSSAPVPVPAEPAQAPPAAEDPAPPPRTFDDRVGDGVAATGRGFRTGAAYAVDVLILRTMGTTATALGFGFFVASSPVWGPTLKLRETWETFVLDPAEYTFERPLGQF